MPMNKHAGNNNTGKPIRKSAAAVFTAVIITFILLLCPSLLSSCVGNSPDESFGHRCTLCIECKTILNNIDKFDNAKLEVLPKNGVILEKCEAGFNEGESVYDMFRREMRARRIHTEVNFALGTQSAYIEGINNIYEFDCGEGSGWLYSVNGVFQSMACSAYKLREGDFVCFVYTCSGGADVGSTTPRE